jgi:hypothetical protein
MAVVMIIMPIHQRPVIPPAGPVTPVIRRIPGSPVGTPEPIVYIRTIYIYRLDDYLCTIYFLIADNLYSYVAVIIFLNIY